MSGKLKAVLLIGVLLVLITLNHSSNLLADIVGLKAVKTEIKAKEIPRKFKLLQKKDVNFTLRDDQKSIVYMKGKSQIIPLKTKTKLTKAKAIDQFFREYKLYLGVNNYKKELNILKDVQDEMGMTHLRYQQIYKDIPVFGGEFFLHLNEDLSLNSIYNKTIPSVRVSTKPKIKEAKVEELAKALWFDMYKSDKAKILSKNLYILNPQIFKSKAKSKNYLVYEVQMIDPSLFAKETFYISAQDGKLIKHLTGTKTIDRTIFDCDSGTCLTAREEGDTAYGDTEVDDLYKYLKNAHDYFDDKFYMDGANNLGGLGISAGEENADIAAPDETYGYTHATKDPRGDAYSFNCGVNGNARWFGWGTVFCDNMVYPKVVAHEYMHAVTDFNSAGLIYESESGAIDEGYSDIFGAAVDNYITPNADWDAAAGAWVIRDVDNPSNTGNPDKYFSASMGCVPDEVFKKDNDYGYVHKNSTVISHAAYLMATGGNFNTCQVSSIGRDKTEKIFFKALTTYLPQNANFNDFFYAITNACDNLYNNLINTANNDPTICREVQKALQSVELEQWGGQCKIADGAAAREPACAAPYITSVNSTTVNGGYLEGERISINVGFSKPVYSDLVTVKPAVGKDRSCTFSLNGEMSKSCWYTIEKGDFSLDLNTESITGIIRDENMTEMIDFIPRVSLAENKDIMVNGVINIPDEITPFDTSIFEENSYLSPIVIELLKNKFPDILKQLENLQLPNTDTTPYMAPESILPQEVIDELRKLQIP